MVLNNAERCQRYRHRHPERVKESQRKFQQGHLEEIRQWWIVRGNELRKERRHKLGISKKYWSELGISYTPEYQKRQHQLRKMRERNGGVITIKTIQLVYEDNIKKYGTMTCVYCNNPIELGKDHLEHKTPLSRGGTNDYENLCVACSHCNHVKHAKTVNEFEEYLRKKEF